MTRIVWLQQWLAFYAQQRSVDRLARMSDHLLEDIGLRRDQLDGLRLLTPDLATDRQKRRALAGSPPARLQTSLKGCG